MSNAPNSPRRRPTNARASHRQPPSAADGEGQGPTASRGNAPVRPRTGGNPAPTTNGSARQPVPTTPAAPKRPPGPPRKRQPTLSPDGQSTAPARPTEGYAAGGGAPKNLLPAGPKRRTPTIPGSSRGSDRSSDPEMEPIPLTQDILGQRIGSKRGSSPGSPGATGTNLALAFAGSSKFKMGEEISATDFEIVLAAEDLSMRRSLVVKLMAEPQDEDCRARFIEEAQINGQLQHPNIVSVYEMGVNQQGDPYMAMARVHGRPLSDVIADVHHDDDDSALGLARRERFLLEVFLKICDAMSFAHSRAIIHRDLTPDAVFVGDYGDVLVANWHVAKPLGRDEAAIEERVMSDRRGLGAPLTVEGTVIGTLPYMPPEQAAGRISQLDEGADIYALGAILFQMLTNEPPYAGEHDDEILADVLEGNLVPPSQRAPHAHIPEELEAIVLKAMAHRRAMRFKTVHDLRHAIEEYLAGRGLNTANATVGVLLKRWASTHKAMVAVVLVVLLALAGGPAAAIYAMYGAAQAEADALREKVQKLEADAKK